jgi:hypothetical protein
MVHLDAGIPDRYLFQIAVITVRENFEHVRGERQEMKESIPFGRRASELCIEGTRRIMDAFSSRRRETTQGFSGISDAPSFT